MVQLYTYENQHYEMDGEPMIATVEIEAQGETMLVPEISMVELRLPSGRLEEISKAELIKLFPHVYELFLDDWADDFVYYKLQEDAKRKLASEVDP